MKSILFACLMALSLVACAKKSDVEVEAQHKMEQAKKDFGEEHVSFLGWKAGWTNVVLYCIDGVRYIGYSHSMILQRDINDKPVACEMK